MALGRPLGMIQLEQAQRNALDARMQDQLAQEREREDLFRARERHDRLLAQFDQQDKDKLELGIKAAEAQAKLGAMMGEAPKETGVAEADLRTRAAAAQGMAQLAAAQAAFEQKRQLQGEEYGYKGALEGGKQAEINRRFGITARERGRHNRAMEGETRYRTDEWKWQQAQNTQQKEIELQLGAIDNIYKNEVAPLHVLLRKRGWELQGMTLAQVQTKINAAFGRYINAVKSVMGPDHPLTQQAINEYQKALLELQKAGSKTSDISEDEIQ